MSSQGQKKADERRARNLASANASRQRRREQISALTQEKARLNEANALLRSRLQISETATLPPLHQIPSSSSLVPRNRTDKIELGPAMQQIVRRREMDGQAVVDLLDRAVSGSKGKGPPVDADAAARFAEAAQKMPKDVERPLKHLTGRTPAKSKGPTSGKPSSAKGKPSSSTKKRHG